MKKIFSALLLAAVTAQLAAAQTSDKGWQIGLAASPDYSYRQLRNSEGNSSIEALKNERDRVESGRFGIAAGADAQRYFSKHLGLSLGLQYAMRNYGREGSGLVFEDQFDPGGIAVAGETVTFKGYHRYHYLELPAGLLYRSNADKKLAFTANGGISVNVLLSTRNHYELSSNSMRRTGDGVLRDMNTFNLSAFVAAGMEFRTAGRFRLRLEPVFRYGLLPVNDGVLKEHLWAAGLRVGASWQL